MDHADLQKKILPEVAQIASKVAQNHKPQKIVYIMLPAKAAHSSSNNKGRGRGPEVG